DWSAGAVEVLSRARSWPGVQGRPRRAGVSSFGISGTNAHVIVEQALPEVAESGGVSGACGQGVGSVESVVRAPVVPWVLSAQSRQALVAQASRLLGRVGGDDGLDPVDVGLSLAQRCVFEHRAVVVGRDREALLAGLSG
ncbi:ketoacyl-synthetase C-terminal extension domain-containing protein, partial [Mycobacterium marinum]|uniref:ketoacyl-synthetase C-terminal extension domain-containing protein n=1 Tax=Mycobacterium marinum TaxID=1781 RepID=UPI002351B9EF